MSRLETTKLVLEYFEVSPQALYHGAQLAVAVLLGYFMAAVAGLPERFWVVVTVLIVMRPDADSTLDVGWDRVRGTVVGCIAGMVGGALKHWGANPILVGLLIIGLLAFFSAVAPMLRSAAVAALIILGAGELAGHSVLNVALLRVLQIGIGVGVCVVLALATPRLNASARLRSGCSKLLARLALQLKTFGVRSRPTDGQMDAASARVRSALLALTTLASSADRRYPWTMKRTRSAAVRGRDSEHRRVAMLTIRVVQDVAIMNRVLNLLCESNLEPLALESASLVSDALASVAGSLVGNGPRKTKELVDLRQICVTNERPGTALLAAPLSLLLEDLNLLSNSLCDAHCTQPSNVPIDAHFAVLSR